MQELSGGAAGGPAPQRIEDGPGGYENGQGDGHGEGDRDLKPWQRGPTGAAAPWQQRGEDRREDFSLDGGGAPPWAARGGGDNYGGYGQGGGYGGPPGGGAAPWQRQNDNAAPPPPSGGQYGYGGYPGGYGDPAGGYGGQQAMGAPPGLGGGAGGLGAPPGLGALFQNYGANGAAGGAPPPPPSDDLPPPVSLLLLRLAQNTNISHSLRATSLLHRHRPATSSTIRLYPKSHLRPFLEKAEKYEGQLSIRMR
jgi:splicing factor 1